MSHDTSACFLVAVAARVFILPSQATEDDGRQIEWLQALCGCLITGEADLENIAGFYSCLSALLQLNHMSVEPFLPTVWSTILDQEEQVPTHIVTLSCRAVNRESDVSD